MAGQRVLVTRGWDRLAMAALGLQAAMVLWHVDLVLVGPDQARDVDVILGIAEGRAFPLLGPMFHAAFKTGPAFYYLAAFPVWLGGNVAWMYAFFALVHVGAALAAWWTVRRFHGPRVAALFAAYGFPAWVVLYMHSAWNPTLVLPLANFLLAAFFAAQHRGRWAWVAVGGLGALLLQIHLSAVPVLAAILVVALVRCRRTDWVWIGGGLALALVLFAPWFVHEFQSGFPYLKAFLHPRAAEGGEFLAHLADFAKWRDAATTLPRFLAGVDQVPDGLRVAGWLELAALALGLLLAWRGEAPAGDRVGAALVAGAWLIASMGFLSFGYVYYLDVVFPWVAWLSAVGLSRGLGLLPTGSAMLVAGGLALVALVPAGMLKLAWAREGILTLHLGDMRFPALPEDRDSLWPFLSDPLVRWYYARLREAGVSPDRVGGAAALLLRESSNRWHHRKAQQLRTSPDPERVWALAGPPFELQPQAPMVAAKGAYRLFDLGRIPNGMNVDFHAERPSDLPFGTEPSPAWRARVPVALPTRCRPGGSFTLAFRCLPRVDGRPPFRIQTPSGRVLAPLQETFISMLYQDFGELRFACPERPMDTATLQPVGGAGACDVNVTPNTVGLGRAR